MTKQEIDSEVLRIIIDVIKEQTVDEDVDDRWREDAKWWLGMIGETFIEVTGWDKFNKEKNYEFGSSFDMENIIDEALEGAGFEKKDK
jgi:hypothetical protein